MSKHLFSPYTLRSIEFRNRIGVSPMCQYSSSDGFVSSWHLVHLGARACGGAGLVIMEATAVEPRGRISPQDAGIWSDEHIEPLARINDFILSQGAQPGLQIAHAGRKASTQPPWEGGLPVPEQQGGWRPVAPSPVAWDENSPVPEELTIKEIRTVQNAFQMAAARARNARFRLLELHGAHGYLIHSFLSPLTNKRTDEYGGSFDNRIRFLMETIEAVRKEWPEELPLSVRLSCKDWAEGGWSLNDSVQLASKMKWKGVDIVDCSSGGIQPGLKYKAGASWQVPMAETIRKEAGVDTMAVGLIVEPMQADAIIRNNRVDMVLLGREMLRNPNWPLDAARTLNKSHLLHYPLQYGYTVKR